VAASNPAQTLRQRESQHEVGGWQEQILLLLQPLLSRTLLALWAVPIAAGVIAVLHFSTIWTLVNMTAQRFCPAALDRPHGLMLTRQHTFGMLLMVSCSMLAKYLSQPYHSI